MKNNQQSPAGRELAGLSSLLLDGLTFLSGTFALWSLTSSLRVTKNFAVTGGLFSNWIVWIGVAIALHQLGRHVERELTAPRLAARVRTIRRPRRAVPPNDTTAAAA